MTIPIPRQRIPALALQEREWLRRYRGSTLGALADQSNQLAFRRGLMCMTKIWDFNFQFQSPSAPDLAKANAASGSKEKGGGDLTLNFDLFESAGVDYFMEIGKRHPAATHIGLIVTYMAPDNIRRDLNGAGTGQKSEIRVKLTDGGSTTFDPHASSGNSWAVVLRPINMPQPRICTDDDYHYETVESNIFEEVSGGITTFVRRFLGRTPLELEGAEEGHAASVLRTVFYVDRGSQTDSTLPRRLEYDTSHTGGYELHFQADYAAILEVTAFDIPHLFVP